LDAERMRGRLATSSLDALEKDYLNYYLRYYRGAQITQSPRLEQQNPDNWLKIHEQYQLRDLWRLSKDEQSYTFWLASDALNNLAPKPEIRARTAPFAIPHPTHVVQDIEVHLIDEWAFEDEEHVVDSDWFEFRFQVRFTGETLNLHYAYRSKVDAVPADALDDYLKAVEQMRDRLDYGLMFPAPAAATTGSPPASEPIHSSLLLDSRGLKLGIVLAILMMLVYVTWEYLRDRRDEALLPPGRYYPVSPLKLYLLSLVTFGVYTVFWGYRNWRYIAMRDGRALWSFPRALFLNFTLYGLYMDERKSAEGTPALRMSVALIAVLSLAYLISTILMNAYWAGYWLFLMLGMLCLLPLACHIHRINEHESEPYRFNSRWRPRHVLLGLFGVLLFAGDAARALYWIPPDTALDGQQLPTHARLFMQRHQVLGPDERLHAFYAEGLLSYAEGGNGFTDDAVVSYWHDPYQQRLQVERARFADIAHLDVQPPSRLNAGLVNIRRHDGSTFTLALPAHTGDAHQFANQLRKYWVMHRKTKRREG
ncbi:MAG: hypothetical protein LPK85_15240, partial [Gammaproteobacteria bacterium]|nr:hypothetical protein [Gammaproteobacteria bacterium]